MATWTLSDIRSKVRKVTGRFSESQLSNSDLDDYINRFYQYTFPAEVKLEKKLVDYTFVTTENQAYYDMPEATYTNFEPPATCNNLSMNWYQDPTYFKSNNPLQYTFLKPWTGDGTTTSYSYTVQAFPIYPGTLTVTDNTETFRDTNETWSETDQSITGSAGGTLTVNYSTGVVTVAFNAAPANGQLIYLNYVLFQPGRPQAILMYDSRFQLYPVPDQAYIISMQSYAVVSALTNPTDSPDLPEWGPAIAYGASRDLFADYGETDAYAETTALYREQINYILTRTTQNLSNQRSVPQF